MFRKVCELLGWKDRPTSPAGIMPEVVMYTRPGCHLCEQAQELLERHGLTVQAIDIDADPVLRDKYNLCVPVVVLDGKPRFRGRVNEILLQRMLAARTPAS